MTLQILVLIVVIILHFALALPFLLGRSEHLRGRKEYLIPILIVPVFGPLMAITIEILFLLKKSATNPLGLESLKLENDIFWTSFPRLQEDKDVIPLEEAILINNIKSRRRAMLNTFRDDSMKYLNVLMVARHNEDVDTPHYATIQISKIQRQFQLKLQDYASWMDRDPDNPALLDDYIDLLESYIQSPLPEKSILQHQREVYTGLLNKKLAMCPNDKDTLIRQLRNYTNMGQNHAEVLKIVEVLKTNWPEDEDIWIEILKASVEWKDQDQLQTVIGEIQSQKIDWTKHGREQVNPWVQL